MFSADEPPPENVPLPPRSAVSPWPFLLADAVLVIVALAVWAASPELSAGQLFFCLGSVALGAIIFATPYVLEKYSPAIRNFMANDSTALNPGGPAAENGNEWRRQAQAAAEAIEHAVRANAALESSARRFDARFAPLVEVQQNLATVAAELRETAAARENAAAGEALSMQREFERLRKEQAEKFKAAEEKISALGETLALLNTQLKTLAARSSPAIEPIEAPVRIRAKAPAPVHVAEPSAIRVEEPVLAGGGVAVLESPITTRILDHSQTAGEIPSPQPSSEPTPSKIEIAPLGSVSLAPTELESPPTADIEPIEEKSMLAKAFARAQSSGQTPAVAGIIMARARRPRKSKPPMPSAVAVTSEATTPVPTEPVASPAKVAEPEGWPSLAEGKLDAVTAADNVSPEGDAIIGTQIESPLAKTPEQPSGDTSSAFRRSARAKAVALRGEDEEAARKDTPVVFTPARVDAPAVQIAEGPTQGELLAREADTIRKKRSSRSPVSACVLTARVLIGIGNKPFVRGTGPGLSSEKGVPMEFVEIGQWRWVAPGMVREAITLRILKNDEVAAEGDPIILHPGQSLEVSPVFSA